MGKPEPKTGRIPAPTFGVNARDQQGAIRDVEALLLENWLPEGDRVRVRDGFLAHTTAGLGSGAVETIAEWRGASGVKLLVAANGGIFDVSSPGTATELTTTAQSSNRWQTACFNGRLIFVNGADAPLYFDGATMAPAGFTATGLTPSNLIYVAPFKSRLYFVEKDTASAWYGAAAGVTGALTEFDFGQIAQHGGNLAAVGTWSNDSGEGLDDYLVAVMESGEILIYGGDYPGDSGWALQGSYMLAPPIGRRCLVKFGGELVVLTTAGPLPVSVAMRGVSPESAEADATWGKIRRKFADLSEAYGAVWGWQAFNHSGVGYFNVPTVVSSTSEQWVLNSTVPAWAKYTGLNAQCFASSGGNLYFGGVDGKVYKVGGASDNGKEIVARAKSAFTSFKQPTKMKRVTMLRPLIETEGTLQCSVGTDLDYENQNFAAGLQSFTVTGTGSLWDAEAWDVPSWGENSSVAGNWVTAHGIGRQISVRFEVRVLNTRVYWYATDIRMLMGDNR